MGYPCGGFLVNREFYMRIWILLTALSLGALGAAQAANVNFLGEAPIAYMNDEDLRLFREAVGKALDDTADGQTVSWSNPKTSAGGEIKLIRTDDMHAELCRIAQVQNQAGGRENRGVYRACKDAKGDWRLVAQGVAAQKPRPQPKPKAEE